MKKLYYFLQTKGPCAGDSFSSVTMKTSRKKTGFLRLVPFIALTLLLVPGSFMLVNGQNTWTGTTNSNWGTATNWSLGRVPLNTDAVVIPNNATGANDNPSVDVVAVCASLTLDGGDQARTLSISGTNSLAVSGAVTINAGTGTGDNKIIAVGAGTLSCASFTIATTGGDDRDNRVTISTGTVTVTGNIAMGGTAARNQIEFTDAGTLNIGGSISGGDIIPSTGTVNYNGSVVQTVYQDTYYTLKCNNSVAGLFAITTLTVTNLTIGDVTPNSFFEIRLPLTTSGTLNLVSGTFKIGYEGTALSWPGFTTNNISAGSTVEYSAKVAQTVSAAPPYANLKVSQESTKTLANNLTINGDLTIVSGTLDLMTYTANRTAPGGTLTINDGATLLVKAANNYPSNYETHALGLNSTVNYAMANAQTVAAHSYGNLTLSGGNTKSFAGAMNIRGFLSIASGTIANLGTSPANSNCLILKLNGVNQVAGTYGSTASAATYKNSTYFGSTATAILNVEDAVTWLGTTGTDWFTLSNWSSGSVPTSATNVVILNTTNKPVIGSAAVCRNINVYSGSSLTISGTNTLTVYGNWNKPDGIDFNANSSTVIFTGSADNIIEGWTQFYNLTINKSANAAKVTDVDDVWPMTSFGVVNDLTVTRGNLELNGSDWFYDVGGDVTIEPAGTLTSNQHFDLFVNGNWTNNGGNYNVTIRPGSLNRIVFTGTGDQFINGTAASQEFYNFKVDKATGTLAVDGSTTSLTVNDLIVAAGTFTAPATFYIDGNVTLSGGAFNAGASTNVKGDWTSNGTTFSPGTGIVTFDGDNQAVGGTNAPLGYHNVVVSSTTAATFNANAVLSGSLDVTGSKILVLSPWVILTVAGE